MTRALAAVWLLGCGGDDDKAPQTDADPDTDTLTPPTTPTTPPADPCEDPLSVAPDVLGVAPFNGTRFRAAGGSGEATFSFVHNVSGGRLAALSGEYVAGARTGVDTVRADDPVCGGSAEASVEVLGDLRVQPLTASVPPTSSFTIEVTGGSGSHRCEPVTVFVGTLAGCTWTAGDTVGTDTIEVVDDATSERVEVRYSVDPAAAVDLWGDHLYVPVDVALAPPLRGGSGVYDLAPSDPSVTVVDGVLTGNSAGRTTIDVVDHFVPSLTTAFELEVVAFRSADPERDGERLVWGQVAGVDVDDDGDDEVLFGTPDVSLAAHDSGGVFLYDPSAGPDPVWSWAVAQQYAATGRSVARGDVNGDGLADLVVGTDGYDENFAADYGRVDVFYGDGAVGGFADTPDVTFRGDSGDRLGHAVAVCDVDGDGVDDVLAAALQDDDPAGVGFYNQGSVAVWAGTTFGVDRVPSGKVHGRTPSGGVFVTDGDAFMGRRLAVGDHDGDGRCDAFATAHTTNLDGAGNDGVTWLFLADSLLASGDPDRIWTWTGADDNVQSGRNLAVGDLDGDGLDDLILGGHAADRGGSSRGAVYVFLAADDDGRAPEQVMDLALGSVVVDGDDDSDSAGLSAAVADVVGDAAAELIVGSQFDELDGGTASVGSVRVFEDPVDAASTTTDAATYAFVGDDVNDHFGTEVAAADTDGDGAPELLVYASRADGEGIEAGGLYVQALDGVRTRLVVPGLPAGQHLGDKGTLGWVDLDADGDDDLVAGAWGAPRGVDGYDAGLVFGWTSGNSPSTTWGGVPNQGANDRFGWGVDRAGDFDGDGFGDLVVLIPYESRPTTFGPEFANPSECPGSLSQTGAAWVFPGTAAGVSTTPSFVFYGAVNDRLETVAGGFDHDGDGSGDLVFGSTLDGPSSEGGVTVVLGRPAAPSGITVVCAPDFRVLGVTGSSRLGGAVSGAGDLDSDGCDELAVGADADDLGFSNQGSARIFWGHGPACDRAAPEVTTLAPLVSNTRVGSGIDGGVDVDGDDVPDVVVGGYDFEVTAGVDVGAAWLLSGAWLATLPTQAASVLPADGATTVTALPADHRLVGDQRDAEFGAEVAVVRAPGGDGYVAVGWRHASLGATSNGVVTLWDWDGTSFGDEPVGVVLGDPGSQLGDALRREPGRAGLGIGAPLTDARSLDAGGVLPITVR